MSPSSSLKSITLIVATDLKGGIGLNNQLLWHLPDDLKRFKALTIGKAIIMGRKTFESIGKALPGRRNIVLSRDADLRIEGAEVFERLEDAIAACKEESICIIGGGEIYRLAFPFATHLSLTKVHTELHADTFFPEVTDSEWTLISSEPHPRDEKHAYAFDFLDYTRKA